MIPGAIQISITYGPNFKGFTRGITGEKHGLWSKIKFRILPFYWTTSDVGTTLVIGSFREISIGFVMTVTNKQSMASPCRL